MKEYFRRFFRDERGSYIILMALTLPLMAGLAGLGTEGAFWLYKKRALQGAADNASYSAATAYGVSTTSDLLLQAQAISAESGLVHGVDGVTVAVNHPPASGCGTASTYNGNTHAIEAVITQTVPRYFASLYSGIGNVTICSRSITMVSGGGDCVLALGGTNTPGITSTANNLTINLSGCSLFSNSTNPDGAISLDSKGNASLNVETIGAVGGVNLGGHLANSAITPTHGNPPIADPYLTQSSSWPAGPSGTLFNAGTFDCPPNCVLSPGNYSKGLTFNSNGTYTLSPGVYYVTGDVLFTKSNTQVNGLGGVTLIVTGSITAKTNNSSLNIIAPSGGSTQGLAIWSKGAGALDFDKNSFTLNVTGLIYAPNSLITFGGNSGAAGNPTCLQVVASQIKFDGNSMYLTGNCAGVAGLKKFGQVTALVE